MKQSIVAPEQLKERERQDSNETGFTALMTPAKEKLLPGHRTTSSSPDVTSSTQQQDSPVRETHARGNSLFSTRLFHSHKKERQSLEMTAPPESTEGGPKRSFEVLNRGNRARRLSTGFASEGGHSGHPSVPRNLSELNWLDRRQNVAAFVS